VSQQVWHFNETSQIKASIATHMSNFGALSPGIVTTVEQIEIWSCSYKTNKQKIDVSYSKDSMPAGFSFA
jgi:hypothetical protein